MRVNVKKSLKYVNSYIPQQNIKICKIICKICKNMLNKIPYLLKWSIYFKMYIFFITHNGLLNLNVNMNFHKPRPC